MVTHGGDSWTHLNVRPSEPPWILPGDDSVRRAFPGYFVACMRSEREGFVTLSCLEGDYKMMQGAAAAEATLKRSWGWDESPVIVVDFVSASLVCRVDPRFEEGVWNAHFVP